MALVALAAAIGAGLYYYNHVNDEIRRRVLEMLAAHYKGLAVEVRSALLVDGEGIEIRGVRISDPRLTGQAAELAYFDEIILHCRTELQEFLSGQPNIERVHIRRPRIRATRLPDGRWSAARLLPCPKFGKHRLETVIDNGVLELIDANRPNSPTFTLRQIDLALHPVYAEYANNDEPVRFEGTFAGDYFQRVTLKGRLEPGDAGFSVDEGIVERLDISPELFDTLPVDVAQPLAAVASLRATCGLTLSLVHRPGQDQPWLFAVDGNLSRGRYDDPRLPQSLTEISAEFHADNGGLTVNELTCKFGQSSLVCFGRLDGFSANAPLFVDITARQLLIGRNWEAILSPELLAQWEKFQPAGEVDARLKLWHDGYKWRPEVTVTCRNVSFTYYKFPYRVDRGRGNLQLKDNHLSLDLVAQAGGREIKIGGEVDNPGPAFSGGVQIWGNDLALESRIIDAMPQQPQRIVRSLHPSVQFGFFLRVYRDAESRSAPSQELTLDLSHGSIRFERFPYPINNIHGIVKMVDGRWWSDDLEGSNGTGRIACRARLEPTMAGPQLTLHFDGQGIALEEELRDALPTPVQKVWNDLRPRGSVDLGVEVSYLAGTHAPKIDVRINKLGENASLQPVEFPYRIDGLRGGSQPVFVYRDGSVDFHQLRGSHGRTVLTASGSCKFDRGAWWLHFERLTADGLRADSDLLAALPPGLKKAVAQLRPTGPINVDGRFDLARDGPDQPLRSGWNVDFNVHQSEINAGPLLENVSGTLHLEGNHNGTQFRSQGEVAIESLSFKDFRFTDVRGPLWIDERQVIFGSQAERPQPNRLARRITARLYGGAVLADLWVGLGDPSNYALEASLSNGDLQVFAREQLAGKQSLQGKVGAGLELKGTGAGLYSMEGRGQIRLSDADIYELPFMVRLLSILSIRLPDKRGFTTSDADFQIAGEHIYLNRIEFSGDAISLLGKGEMNLNTDVQATLSAIVGRSDWQLAIFKNAMGQASKQLMQIRVDGNLADLQIHREPFPALNQALEQLQAGMQPRVQSLPTSIPPQAMAPSAGRR